MEKCSKQTSSFQSFYYRIKIRPTQQMIERISLIQLCMADWKKQDMAIFKLLFQLTSFDTLKTGRGYIQLDIMNEIVWNKQIVIKVEMAPHDIADWIAPLPLFINAHWHHYIGFYQTLITEFFTSFIPYPHQPQQITLRMPTNNIVLDGTQIVSHLFALYFQESNSIIELECEFRQAEVRPQIDLMRFYKQNLKASTSIRYGKFGASVITVDMSVNNIESMFTSLQKNELLQFLGDLDPASTKLGFKFIVSNDEKIQNVPVRIVGNGWRVERSIKKGTVFQDFWKDIVGSQDRLKPKLHGISLKYLKINIQKLQEYCHPDGYLYFTL